MRRCLPLLLAVFLVRCGDEGEDRSCYADEECGDAGYCDGAVPSVGCEGGTPGTCQALRSDGETCGDGLYGGCRPELTCHDAFDPPECRPPSPPGGPCRRDSDCDDDLDHLISSDDPICVGAESFDTLGVCAAAGSISTGGACETFRACAPPDNCVEEVCRGPGAAGERCATEGVADDRPACADGLYCDGDERCRLYVVEGERCSPRGDRCAPGLFCYSQEAVCHAPLAAGDVCLAGDTCATGLFCSSRAVCAAPLGEGEACWGADRCAEGLFCYSREAVCHRPLAAGEGCEPFQDTCAGGLACDPDDEVCREPV